MAQRRSADSFDTSDDSLNAFAVKLRAFRDARGWQSLNTPRNLAMSVAVECGELLEHFLWLEDHETSALPAERRDEIASELADVAIYLIQLADTLGISLSVAIADKMRLNDERYPATLDRNAPDAHTT
jgi:NTP pyrophosphatase (non-canonical NTP hydrolase)